jgi:hypothetical protein
MLKLSTNSVASAYYASLLMKDEHGLLLDLNVRVYNFCEKYLNCNQLNKDKNRLSPVQFNLVIYILFLQFIFCVCVGRRTAYRFLKDPISKKELPIFSLFASYFFFMIFQILRYCCRFIRLKKLEQFFYYLSQLFGLNGYLYRWFYVL